VSILNTAKSATRMDRHHCEASKKDEDLKGIENATNGTYFTEIYAEFLQLLHRNINFFFF
jgi:hypothetical protein